MVDRLLLLVDQDRWRPLPASQRADLRPEQYDWFIDGTEPEARVTRGAEPGPLTRGEFLALQRLVLCGTAMKPAELLPDNAPGGAAKLFETARHKVDVGSFPTRGRGEHKAYEYDPNEKRGALLVDALRAQRCMLGAQPAVAALGGGSELCRKPPWAPDDAVVRVQLHNPTGESLMIRQFWLYVARMGCFEAEPYPPPALPIGPTLPGSMLVLHPHAALDGLLLFEVGFRKKWMSHSPIDCVLLAQPVNRPPICRAVTIPFRRWVL